MSERVSEGGSERGRYILIFKETDSTRCNPQRLETMETCTRMKTSGSVMSD